MTLFCRLVFALLLLWAHKGVAEVYWKSDRSIELQDSDLRYWVDEFGELGIEQVKQAKVMDKFIPMTETGSSFGWVKHPHWFLLTIVNTEREKQVIYLETKSPLLDDIRVFGLDENYLQQFEFRTGDHFPFSERPVRDTHFVFPVKVLAQSKTHLFIRVETTSSLLLPIKLWQQDDFYDDRTNFLLGQGLFYGMLLVMIFYNLFLYFSIKRVAYLYYVLFVSCFAVLQSSLKGFSTQFLWPDYPILTDYGIATGGGVCLLFLSLFARDFLRLDNTHYLRQLNNALNLVAVVLIASSLFLPYSAVIKYIASAVILGSFSLIFSAVYRYVKGYKEARFYLLAWFAMVTGSTIYLLKQFGILPVVFITEYSMQIGSALEIVLLSLALADRLNTLRTKLEDANRLLSSQNTVLEQEVDKRTSELVSALDELEKVNRQLSDISITDKLTGLKNRHFFDKALNKEMGDKGRKRLPMSLIILDIDNFKKINDSYGHVTGDKVIIAVANCLSLFFADNEYVFRFGGEEFVILLPETDQFGAALLAENLRKAVEKIEVIDQNTVIHITVSLGLATSTKLRFLNQTDLMRAADTALYNAKDDGKNCLHVAKLDDAKSKSSTEIMSKRYNLKLAESE